MSIRTATSNGRHPVVGFDNSPVPGDDERVFGVSDNKQSFQSPEYSIRPPILGQFHGPSQEIPAELVQFFLKLCKKGEGICRGPSKTSKNFVMVDLSNLPGSMLHDRMFKGHLTISRHDYFSFMPNG